MPIVFIMSGLFFIFMIFGLLRTYNNVLNFIVLFILSSILLSFIFPDVVVGRVKFDILLAIAISIMIVVFISFVDVGIWDVVLILLSSIIYKMFLDNDLKYLISYNNSLALGVIVIFSIVYINSFQRGIMYVTISSLMQLFISTNVDLMNLNFSQLDLNFVFNALIIFLAVYVMFNCVKYFLSKNYRRIYGKKVSDNINLTAYIFI